MASADAILQVQILLAELTEKKLTEIATFIQGQVIENAQKGKFSTTIDLCFIDVYSGGSHNLQRWRKAVIAKVKELCGGAVTAYDEVDRQQKCTGITFEVNHLQTCDACGHESHPTKKCDECGHESE